MVGMGVEVCLVQLLLSPNCIGQPTIELSKVFLVCSTWNRGRESGGDGCAARHCILVAISVSSLSNRSFCWALSSSFSQCSCTRNCTASLSSVLSLCSLTAFPFAFLLTVNPSPYSTGPVYWLCPEWPSEVDHRNASTWTGP